MYCYDVALQRVVAFIISSLHCNIKNRLGFRFGGKFFEKKKSPSHTDLGLFVKDGVNQRTLFLRGTHWCTHSGHRIPRC